MDTNSFRDHLAKLHAELTEAHRSDPKDPESLSKMMQDIHGLMDKAESTPAADKSLSDRLESMAVQFEADHPTLAASARRLVDLLGEVGI
jgi:Domain of unknown function (DUF4404)